MGLGHSPRIVTDGLILLLDAANTKSYPGSGTTWTDLSGNRNNGIAVNSPTYNSSGFFTFDGSTQRFGCGNAANLRVTVGSISAWFAADNTNTSYNGIITKQNAWGLFVLDNVLAAYDWGNNVARNTGITVGNNSWNHAVMTFTETTGTPSNNAKIYLNGSEVLTTTVRNSSQTIEVQIGDGNGDIVSNQFYGGKIAAASVYNRVLSAIEVQQNFNAYRGRFGI